MKAFTFLIVPGLWMAGVQAQTPAPQPAATTPGASQTVITSDTLDLNLSKTKGQKQGLFRGNVKVDEPRFSMTSKEMTVFFAEDDSVQDVEAREDVVIKRKDGSSETWSEKAVYNMKEKKLILLKVTKQPKAISQDKTVFADKIILFPEEDKMLTEGASRVMLQKAP
jgi:lipopolysaccharide export system protein LptA